MRHFLACLAVATISAVPAAAQNVLSAKAGVVHYVEGDVTISRGKVVTSVTNPNNGRFAELKEGDILQTTKEGRAEVLLNPGVFLRLGEESEIRMISNRLSDVRLELTHGTALVEAAEVLKDNAITILAGKAEVNFSKMGLARLQPTTGVRVYKGQATVTIAGTSQVLREGREMLFEGDNVVAKFDAKSGDALYRWANRRAEYIAMANIASANMARSSGASFSQSGWYFNQFYGMMTFLPIGSTLYRSPFGYMFYSPSRINRYYQAYVQPPVMSSGGGGYSGASAFSQNHGYYINSGRSAASAPTYNSAPVSAPGAGAAAAAPPADAGRGAGSGTGRGGGAAQGQ